MTQSSDNDSSQNSLNKLSVFEPALLAPGPTQFAQRPRQQFFHRSPAFETLQMELAGSLQNLFGGDCLPIMLSCSGSGAMEAGLQNLVPSGSKVIAVNGGKFGERWVKIARHNGYECIEHVIPWGECPDPEALAALADSMQGPVSLLIQAGETSTGAYYKIRELVARLRASKTFADNASNNFIIVDAISTLGVHEMQQSAWGIDMVISSSQKALNCDPGLSFVSVSQSAWKAMETRNQAPSLYFDLLAERDSQYKGRFRFTPPIGIVQMAHDNLRRMEDIGFDKIYARHACISEAMQQACESMELDCLAKNSPHRGLTAIVLPKKVNGGELIKSIAAQYAVRLAGGQDNWKNRLIRFGHMGLFSPFQVISGMAALEWQLHQVGHNPTLGKASSALVKSIGTKSSSLFQP